MRLDKDNILILSRRNLVALLAKLDLPKGQSVCMIQGGLDAKFMYVMAEEDDDHYVDRSAGKMHPREEAHLPKPKTGVE